MSVDFLAAVASYPKPDDKIRSTSFEVLYFLFTFFFQLTLVFIGKLIILVKQVQGGGNTGNALTCAARLGLTPRIISKVCLTDFS